MAARLTVNQQARVRFPRPPFFHRSLCWCSSMDVEQVLLNLLQEVRFLPPVPFFVTKVTREEDGLRSEIDRSLSEESCFSPEDSGLRQYTTDTGGPAELDL